MYIKKFIVGNLLTNMYLCYDDNKKGFLVDAPSFDKNVVEFIKKEGIDVKFILLTHTHADHIMGLNYFKKELNIKCYASEESKFVYRDKSYTLLDYFGEGNYEIDIDGFLKDKEIFSEFKILCLKTPGHTEDSMSYVVDNKIFSGDTLFNLSIGRTDFPGGDYNSIIKSIKERILIFDNHKVFPGHGEITDVETEKRSNPFLN